MGGKVMEYLLEIAFPDFDPDSDSDADPEALGVLLPN